MQTESAVEFATDSRIHIGLEVTDRDRAIAFYQVLFGIEPAKVRPRYAKFEPADPPVILSLNENPGARGQRPASLHYGIQVKSTKTVQDMEIRLSNAGLQTRIEEQTACCYAVQTKVWVSDPDGNPWEIYVVLDDQSPQRTSADNACCADDCCSG